MSLNLQRDITADNSRVYYVLTKLFLHSEVWALETKTRAQKNKKAARYLREFEVLEMAKVQVIILQVQ